MRFAELDLIRYGRFEDCSLRFRPGAPDLHVVFGRNEAGKSTTLAAVTDLLFGFEPRTPYGFRFDNKLLRVGAVLERDGTRLPVRRRKSNKDSLVDAEDRAIDEGPLTAWLHGQTRRTFELGSGLNHRQLRAGGEAILAAKDDVGTALFAAGSGLIGVQRVREALDAEADAIWAKRAAEKRSYTRAEREHAAATKVQRDAEVRPKTWVDARTELDRQEGLRRDLETRQQAARAELRTLERTRRASAPARRRRDLLAELETQTAVLLPHDIEAVADAALLARAEAERVCAAAVDLRDDAGTRLASLTVDEAVLAKASDIEALMKARGAEQKGQDDLPRRSGELQGRLRERAGLLRELGLAESDNDTAPLPSRIVVDKLRRLAGEIAKAGAALATLRQGEAEAVDSRDRLRAQLADAAVPEEHEQVSAAVAAALRLGDIDALCDRQARASESAEAERALAAARLDPWMGTTDDLARLAPPSDAEIDEVVRELEALRSMEEAATAKAAALSDEAAQVALQREHLAASQQAVSTEMVARARNDRHEVWTGLRDHLLGDGPLMEPASEAARFEKAVATADDAADRRFLSAEASGELSALDGRAALLGLQQAQARQQGEQAIARRVAILAGWTARLESARLPALAPSQTRAWLNLRTDALEKAATAVQASEAARVEAARRDAALTGLRAALGETLASETRLAPTLLRAQARMAAGEALAAAFRALKERQKAAEEAATVSARRLSAAGIFDRESQEAWDAALAQAGVTLPPDEAETRLGLIEQLRAVEEAVTGLQHRISAIDADRVRFEASVAHIVGALGGETQGRTAVQQVDDLWARLTQARIDAQAHASLTAEVERHAAALRAAEAARSAADHQLAPAMTLAGSRDVAALHAAVAASRQLRTLRAQVREQENLITAIGELGALLAACEVEDDEALAARADRLEAELSHVTALLGDAGEKAGAARGALATLEGGPGAAAAAADVQAARAEMEVQAESYLRKRSQEVILRWAMERYRERRQNPLLDRAGALFRTLTLGRYTGLRIDTDPGHTRLLGLCADGETLLDVEAMSEGTVDQLYLALRLAAVEQANAAGVRLPFLADDLFVNFDDDRAAAGFQVLGELARSTQVLFFTHHRHLLNVAEAALGVDVVTVCELS